MIPFDLNTAPLEGVTLIEAGAGTGKTYTLAGIFLRLLVERGFGIDQILVVTYTRAATEELKSRIRRRLLTARAVLRGQAAADDDLMVHMTSRVAAPANALQRVEDALTDFDRAAIFTIHGFCQRLLQNFAFETGHLFHSELVQEQNALVQEVADDFWRRYISNAPYELVHYALKLLKGPEQLAAILGYCRYPDLTVLPRPVKPLLNAIKPWRKIADRLIRIWISERDAILNLLLTPGLNARTFGKCEADPLHPGMTQRGVRLMRLGYAMDHWNGKYPLIGEAERFGASFLEKATKKNHTAPTHVFFDLCQEALEIHDRLEDQLSAYLRYLKIRLHGQARQRLDEKKGRKNLLFFDDLLLRVHNALSNSQGSQLVRAVTGQYNAALVDEFQDTDPLQYKIFQRLFGDSGRLLVMIGDPKQAIYSFRGADIFSYLKASEDAQTNTTLTRNWRSTPTLVRAVNTIFQNHTRPFGFERIRFNCADAARPDSEKGNLPMKIWWIPALKQDGKEKPVNQEAAVDIIAAAVSEEIVRLISDRASGITTADIAVLTRTHRQSQMVKKALARCHVPAVLHSAGSVFETPEAESMARLLAAAAAPNDPVAVRAVMANDLIGVRANEFYAGLQAHDERWRKRWSAFALDHRNWARHGFYPMFRGFLDREKVRSRLLCQPEGERRLTNLLHLAELLHRAETEQQLGMEGLIQWLTTQRQSPEKGSDEQQLRLESDSLAVRIITMHKSKGLQFEVVFCPFLWSGVHEDKNAAVFHDSDRDKRLTLAVGPGIEPAHLLQARKEALAENLRMMYVALTRAQRVCYTVWGRINGTEVSAPAYLFHASQSHGSGEDWITPLAQKLRSLDDDGMLAELKRLAQRSSGSITIAPVPRITGAQYQSDAAPTVLADCREVTRSDWSRWRIASFSSLTAGQAGDDHEWPDRDPAVSSVTEPSDGAESFESLFGFPKGVAAGLFFHDILEHWDPAPEKRPQWNELISTGLKSHGFDQRWSQAVNRMLLNLAETSLHGRNDAFTLSQVSPDGRINEMAFYFPLRSLDLTALKSLFARFGPATMSEKIDKRLDRMGDTKAQGYLKGYIDAIFRFGERYYLVDWKSNYLGDDYGNYASSELAMTVAADDYFLQYNLYVTALDRLLQQRIENYDYHRHFGGVFYIFLRGIGSEPDNPTGIFYDYPDPRLVSGLSQLLIDRGATYGR